MKNKGPNRPSRSDAYGRKRHSTRNVVRGMDPKRNKGAHNMLDKGRGRGGFALASGIVLLFVCALILTTVLGMAYDRSARVRLAEDMKDEGSLLAIYVENARAEVMAANDKRYENRENYLRASSYTFGDTYRGNESYAWRIAEPEDLLVKGVFPRSTEFVDSGTTYRAVVRIYDTDYAAVSVQSGVEGLPPARRSSDPSLRDKKRGWAPPPQEYDNIHGASLENGGEKTTGSDGSSSVIARIEEFIRTGSAETNDSGAADKVSVSAVSDAEEYVRRMTIPTGCPEGSFRLKSEDREVCAVCDSGWAPEEGSQNRIWTDDGACKRVVDRAYGGVLAAYREWDDDDLRTIRIRGAAGAMRDLRVLNDAFLRDAGFLPVPDTERGGSEREEKKLTPKILSTTIHATAAPGGQEGPQEVYEGLEAGGDYGSYEVHGQLFRKDANGWTMVAEKRLSFEQFRKNDATGGLRFVCPPGSIPMLEKNYAYDYGRPSIERLQDNREWMDSTQDDSDNYARSDFFFDLKKAEEKDSQQSMGGSWSNFLYTMEDGCFTSSPAPWMPEAVVPSQYGLQSRKVRAKQSVLSGTEKQIWEIGAHPFRDAAGFEKFRRDTGETSVERYCMRIKLENMPAFGGTEQGLEDGLCDRYLMTDIIPNGVDRKLWLPTCVSTLQRGNGNLIKLWDKEFTHENDGFTSIDFQRVANLSNRIVRIDGVEVPNAELAGKIKEKISQSRRFLLTIDHRKHYSWRDFGHSPQINDYTPKRLDLLVDEHYIWPLQPGQKYNLATNRVEFDPSPVKIDGRDYELVPIYTYNGLRSVRYNIGDPEDGWDGSSPKRHPTGTRATIAFPTALYWKDKNDKMELTEDLTPQIVEERFKESYLSKKMFMSEEERKHVLKSNILYRWLEWKTENGTKPLTKLTYTFELTPVEQKELANWWKIVSGDIAPVGQDYFEKCPEGAVRNPFDMECMTKICPDGQGLDPDTGLCRPCDPEVPEILWDGYCKSCSPSHDGRGRHFEYVRRETGQPGDYALTCREDGALTGEGARYGAVCLDWGKRLARRLQDRDLSTLDDPVERRSFLNGFAHLHGLCSISAEELANLFYTVTPWNSSPVPSQESPKKVCLPDAYKVERFENSNTSIINPEVDKFVCSLCNEGGERVEPAGWDPGFEPPEGAPGPLQYPKSCWSDKTFFDYLSDSRRKLDNTMSEYVRSGLGRGYVSNGVVVDLCPNPPAGWRKVEVPARSRHINTRSLESPWGIDTETNLNTYVRTAICLAPEGTVVPDLIGLYDRMSGWKKCTGSLAESAEFETVYPDSGTRYARPFLGDRCWTPESGTGVGKYSLSFPSALETLRTALEQADAAGVPKSPLKLFARTSAGEPYDFLNGIDRYPDGKRGILFEELFKPVMGNDGYGPCVQGFEPRTTDYGVGWNTEYQGSGLRGSLGVFVPNRSYSISDGTWFAKGFGFYRRPFFADAMDDWRVQKEPLFCTRMRSVMIDGDVQWSSPLMSLSRPVFTHAFDGNQVGCWKHFASGSLPNAEHARVDTAVGIDVTVDSGNGNYTVRTTWPVPYSGPIDFTLTNGFDAGDMNERTLKYFSKDASPADSLKAGKSAILWSRAKNGFRKVVAVPYAYETAHLIPACRVSRVLGALVFDRKKIDGSGSPDGAFWLYPAAVSVYESRCVDENGQDPGTDGECKCSMDYQSPDQANWGPNVDNGKDPLRPNQQSLLLYLRHNWFYNYGTRPIPLYDKTGDPSAGTLDTSGLTDKERNMIDKGGAWLVMSPTYSKTSPSGANGLYDLPGPKMEDGRYIYGTASYPFAPERKPGFDMDGNYISDKTIDWERVPLVRTPNGMFMDREPPSDFATRAIRIEVEPNQTQARLCPFYKPVYLYSGYRPARGPALERFIGSYMEWWKNNKKEQGDDR